MTGKIRIILNDLRTETLSAAQTGKPTSDKMQLFTIPVTKYCSWWWLHLRGGFKLLGVTILSLRLKVIYRLYRDVIITFYLWEKEFVFFFFINMSVTSGEAQKIFSWLCSLVVSSNISVSSNYICKPGLWLTWALKSWQRCAITFCSKSIPQLCVAVHL